VPLPIASAFCFLAAGAKVEEVASRGNDECLHIAARLVCRFGLADTFKHLVLPEDFDCATMTQTRDSLVDPSVAYLKLDHLGCVVHVVDDCPSLSAASIALCKSGVIGLDCEWRPFKSGKEEARFVSVVHAFVPFPALSPQL